MSSDTPLDLGDGLSIRTYSAYDDAACRALERTASQFQGFGGLVKAAIKHHAPFDTKPRQFISGYVLLVCVDERVTTEHNGGSGGAVCGAICVGLKDAFVHGRQRRCGFVFDLRVDERWQRRGIGAALAREAERRSAMRGAEWLYLSVNRDNKKATKLYTKLGWSAASTRRLLFTPLLLPPRCVGRLARGGRGRRHPPLLGPGGRGARGTPFCRPRPRRKEVDAFSKSSLHLGVWVASDGCGSRAALRSGTPRRSRRSRPSGSLPVAVWQKLVWPLSVAATAVSTVGFSALLVPLTPAGRHAAMACLAAATATGVLFVNSAALARRVPRARLCARLRGRRVAAAHARSARPPARRGARAAFALVVVNEDADSPLVECLGKTGGRTPTAFLQKWLLQGQAECPPLRPDGFFDPRDI